MVAGFPLLQADWLLDAIIIIYRLALAVALGVFLGYGHVRGYLTVYALIALCAATYVSIFRYLGVPKTTLVYELMDTAVWLGLAGIAIMMWRWHERRAKECYTIFSAGAALLCGVLVGFDESTAAIVLAYAALLLRLVVQHVRREK